MIEKVARLSALLFLAGLLSLPVYAAPQDTTSGSSSSSTSTAPAQTSDQQSTSDSTDNSSTDKKAKTKKVPKNGDVDDIGTRNINKGQINFISIDKEIQLGRQLSAEVERQVKLLNDPVIGEYINRVGQNLVRNSDAKVPFTIKVVQSDDINAFALPGGFFYVNTGLIAAADNEAELAAVMGHEIAHVAARHGTENESKGELMNALSIPLIFLGGPAGFAIRQTAGFLVPLQFLQFSRANEAEADYLGLQYMYAAGYDPSAFVSMFEKLQAKESARAGGVSPMFATHPATADRIEHTKKNIETVLEPKEQYVVTTSEFDNIKARLAMLENRKSTDDDNNGSGKPSLIKRTGSGRNTPTDPGSTNGRNGNGNGSSTTSDDDSDRPVLRRRDGSDSGTPSSTDSGSGTSTTTTPSTTDSPSTTSPDNSNTTTQPSTTDPDDNDRPVLIRKPGAGGAPPLQ